MVDVKRVVVNDGADGATWGERAVELVETMEKLLNTGPIIGEARELCLSMSANILARDIILDGMGMDLDKREKAFIYINEQMEKHDAEILAERKKDNSRP